MNVRCLALLAVAVIFLTNCASSDRMASIFNFGQSSIVDASPISPRNAPVAPSPSPRGCAPDYAESTGVLDTSYNGTGMRLFDNAGFDRTFANPVITSDCKILNAFYYQGSNNSVVVKMGFDGTLDTSFGTNGISLGFSGYTVGALLLLPDGKYILVASAGTNLKFSRFLSDGSLDTSYNPPLHNMGAVNIVSAVQLTSTGGIYIMFNQYLLKKFDGTGSLDTAFGAAGSLDTGLLYTGWYHSSGLLIDGQGNVIVGGNNGQDFTLKRFDSNGALDTSFGASGTTVTPVVGTTTSHIASLKYAPNGTIVAMGTPTLQATGASLQYAFARFSSNGILDTAFGSNGTIVSGSGGRHPSAMRNFEIDQVTGKFYAGAYSSGWTNWRIERFTTNGTLDTTFASNGYYQSTTGPSDGTNFVLTSWGKLYAVTGSMFSIFTWMFK